MFQKLFLCAELLKQLTWFANSLLPSKITFNDGDEILISHMEHHSNIVPGNYFAKEKNLKLKVVPVNDINLNLFLKNMRNCFLKKTKLVSIVHISNALGTINPVKEE